MEKAFSRIEPVELLTLFSSTIPILLYTLFLSSFFVLYKINYIQLLTFSSLYTSTTLPMILKSLSELIGISLYFLLKLLR